MSNKLAGETSPYLLQHADNPVEWYPWGPEALALARDLDKPILLSVGYAACHWCHVMAHESFEDEATAAIMNRYFVNIKVDREERPDIDSIYMGAVQALNNGQGGWPMTVFMTPDGEPFYGGTYYPPVPRYGMPSFSQLLESIAAAWQTKRDEINSSAQNIAAHLSRTLEPTGPSTAPNEALFDQALDSILRQFDSRDGGFGGAPKFPPSMTLEFLLRMVVARDDPMAMHMVEHTLKRMAHGGIYDQIGGGFARYATDIRWLVPHFEKMLYDNALLARVYLHAYQISGRPLFRRIVEETLDFVARDMRHKDGGFYSSYDADSEGVEGKFYVWQEEEIRQVLGGDADLFKARYGVSAAGNWEGQNILEIVADIPDLAQRFDLDQEEVTQRLDSARQRLLKARAERAWPGLDDKVLTAWNGLMMAAFAEAGRALQRADYTAIAADNALFLWNKMRDADGRLLRTWNPASDASLARYNAYLEDYAFLADGLLALYQTTFETRWFAWAEELAQHMLTHFHDANNGGFFDTSDDHESLLYRPKDLQDNAIPSGNAMAVQVLQKLSLFTGNGRYWDAAQDSLQRLTGLMARFPTGFAHWLCATAFALGSPLEIAIAGTLDEPGTRTLLDALNTGYRPNLVLAVGEENQEIPLLQGRSRLDGSPAAYVCRQFVCKMPVTTPQELLRQLN